jgi:CBS domain-containing protein
MVESGRIDEIMMPDIDTIGPQEEIRVARRRMESQTRRSLIVVEGDAPIGVIEWRGIMRESEVPASSLVQDYMVREIPVLRPGMSLAEAQTYLGQVDLDRIPVVDESGRLVGEVPRTALSHYGGEADAAPTMDSGKVHGLAGDTDEIADTTRSDSATAVETSTASGTSIKDGMTVIGSGGSKLGTVDEVILEPSGEASAFLVKHGFISHKHKRINADVVELIDGDNVVLKIDQTEFKMLANEEDRE